MESQSHMWYRRTFKIPEYWKDNVLLNFGAVDYEGEFIGVYLCLLLGTEYPF